MSKRKFDSMADTKNTFSLLSHILAVLMFLVGCYLLNFVPEQSDFNIILGSASLAFAGYVILTFFQKNTLLLIFGLGVLVRLLILFSFPNLSDDIYRFLWDGQLISCGYNPYGYLPSKLINEGIDCCYPSLYAKMNSPDYYTIYPPFTQFIFYVSTLFGGGVVGASFTIKLIFIIAECFTFAAIIRLLKQLGKGLHLSAIYFLNPLVITEGVGNLHFEVLMVAFFAWAIVFLFLEKRYLLGALFMVLSIAAKLLPLMFLPYFLFRLKEKERIQFFIYIAIGLAISFSPIAFGLDFGNFGASIDLYFQKFEFNASIYYLLRYFGKLMSGYNLIHYIGPILGFITMLSILHTANKKNHYSQESFIAFSFISFVTYLFLATTVHPWYLFVPIFLSCFLKLRFVILWSFMILISYINYSFSPYFENLFVIAFEYIVVFSFLTFELLKSKKNIFTQA